MKSRSTTRIPLLKATRMRIDPGCRGGRWLGAVPGILMVALGVFLPTSYAGAAAPRSRPNAPPAAEAGVPVKTFMGASYVVLVPWAARYGLKPVWVEKGRSLRLESAFTKILVEEDRREVTINNLRIFLGEPVVSSKGSLWIGAIDARDYLGPILRPAGIAVSPRPLKVICIDAGHGGNDTGTQNKRFKLDEKSMTLDVAQRVRRLLEGQGYRVVMTRNDDRFVELEDRADIANRAKADLFVSVHFNSFPQPSITGTEVYILTRSTQRSTGATKRETSDRVSLPGNAMDPWNAVLGYAMHRQLKNKLATFDRGLKFARFKVLTLVDCPGVLVEAGYLSNDAEARKISTADYRGDIAEGIVNGIAAYAAQLEAARKG
ncbi:MAG: N-acetylmuramoyl-L-alanine amidase [Opitutaceae bacterium]|nr:N-acetylmuramoyl-L-alanine amidase [Opitutaceae bacterium]